MAQDQTQPNSGMYVNPFGIGDWFKDTFLGGNTMFDPVATYDPAAGFNFADASGQGTDWSGVVKDLIRSLGPSLAAAFIMNKFYNPQGEALDAASRIAGFQAALQGQQAEMDLPYRQGLLNRYQTMAQRPIPRFLPGAMPVVNPYETTVRAKPLVSPPTEGFEALTSQAPQWLQPAQVPSLSPIQQTQSKNRMEDALKILQDSFPRT